VYKRQVVGWIPILLNASVRDQVIVSNFVVVTKTILSSTWLGLIVSCILTYKILQVATEPQRRRKRDWIGMIAQWVLVPVAGLFFGCLPCLDSITRLMLGKYMGFKVTSKASAS
jgi:hypothetical protein